MVARESVAHLAVPELIAEVENAAQNTKLMRSQLETFQTNSPEAVGGMNTRVLDLLLANDGLARRVEASMESLRFNVNEASNRTRAISTTHRHAKERYIKVLVDLEQSVGAAKAMSAAVHILLANAKIVEEETAPPPAAPQEGAAAAAVLEKPPLSEVEKQQQREEEHTKKLVKDDFASPSFTLQNLAEAFDPQVPAVWKADSELATAIKEFVSKCTDKIDAKSALADSTMVKNPTWGGLQGPLLTGTAVAKDLPNFEGLELAKGGHEPFLCTMKRNHARFGPAMTALPGIPSLVFSVSEPLVVGLLPAQIITEGAVDLDNTLKYLEGPSGPRFIDQDMRFFRLAKGDVGFLPYGFVPMLVAPSFEASEKKKPGWCHVWSLPLFAANLYKPANEGLVSAIKKFNMAYVSSAAARNAQWKTRKARLEKLFTGLSTAAAAEQPAE